MKAAIYCRLSKEDEVQGKRCSESESIQNQKSMLMQYAIDHGLEVYQIYCDEDYSGADRNRPDFNRMLQAASEGKFQVILAKTQSRFTRDMELVETYLHGKFLEWGVRFIAVVDHVDTKDPAGKKSRQINGLINEWYLEDLSNNVRSVLDHKRKNGQYIATFALYGYEKDPQDHNRIRIDPEAAQIVKRIFSLYLAGNGTTRIACILNQEKIPSPTQYKQMQGLNYKRPLHCKNGDLWSKATIYRMLTTQTYAGDLEQGRHKKVSYKSQKTVWLPRNDWIVVPNANEPIIDKETFQRVQQMLGQRARSGGNGRVNPLAGKVFCGLCGSSMEQTGSGGRTKYFRCRMSQRDCSRCTGQRYMQTEELKRLVLERMQVHTGHCAAPQWSQTDQLALQFKNKASGKEKERQRLENQLKRRCTALQELYLDKSSGLLSADQFWQLNQAYRQQAEEYRQQIQQLDKQMEGELTVMEQAKSGRQKLIEALHAKALTRELVCLLIDRVIIYPPDENHNSRTIEIQWNF